MNCNMQIYVTSCLQTCTFYKWIYVRISIEKWGHSFGAPSFFMIEWWKPWNYSFTILVFKLLF
jgi:hypothetical protein